jgi:cation diffusion facilitator family transporter
MNYPLKVNRKERYLDSQDKTKVGVALLSVASNAALVALKVAAGLMIGSVSIISEALHSGADLLAALIAFFAVKVAGKPADESHPFGHTKVENISGTVEAILIFVAAGWIIFEAAKKLTSAEPLEEVSWGVAVMLISCAVNIFVSGMLFKVGKNTGSVALQADAWHLRTDVYTSAGVMLGLAAIWLGDIFFPGMDLKWIDPVVAIVVAFFIIKAAIRLTLESARDLIDVSLPQEEEKEIRRHIMAFAPTVRGFHKLRTRKGGAVRFVDFHVRMDASMSVEESHRVADMITCSIKQHYPGTLVTIHIEPCNCSKAEEESCGCILSDAEKKVVMAKCQEQAGV